MKLSLSRGSLLFSLKPSSLCQ